MNLLQPYKLFEGSERVIAYHVAPSKYDTKISKEGIKAVDHVAYTNGIKKVVPAKNYFWLTYKNARWFKRYHQDPELQDDPTEMTIWQVDLTGYELHKDPEAADMSQYDPKFGKGEDGQAVFTFENIPPDRLSRIG